MKELTLKREYGFFAKIKLIGIGLYSYKRAPYLKEILLKVSENNCLSVRQQQVRIPI